MPSDETIRHLLQQSVQGLEPEPTAVLADALLETDRPDLGEDLALLLANRQPFPRNERGRPFVNGADRERAYAIVGRRIHRRFAWSDYDRAEQRQALRELARTVSDWNASHDVERRDKIYETVAWLDEDVDDSPDDILYERASWLLNGVFGRGAQILAEEIVDAAPSRRNREAQLFRLVLAFDDNLPETAVNRIWESLSAPAKRHATATMRRVILENGGELHAPRPRTRKPR